MLLNLNVLLGLVKGGLLVMVENSISRRLLGCWRALFPARIVFSPFIHACKARFGTMVADYWTDNQWVNINSIEPTLNSLMLLDTMLKDRIVWVGTSC